MLQTKEVSAEEMFNKFMSTHVDTINDYSHIPIEETDLSAEYKKYALKLTHFDDIYDTLMYSNLIRKAIDLHDHPEEVIDLGAGSSIPSLLAIKNSSKKNIKATAVDIDPEAKIIGHQNAESLGLKDAYRFIEARLETVLQNINSSSTIVVSNPPYIPAPKNMTDHQFVPINGGEDGADYMMGLLNHNYPKGSVVAFLWGSLTNPARVLPVLEDRFEILHVEAMKIHFGKYTSHPEIYSHLCELREEGKVVFNDDRTQIVLGTILKAK